MKLVSLVSVLVMVSMALLADYLLKIAGTKPTMINRYFIGGAVVYSLTAFVWYFVLRNIKFSGANLLYSIFTILLSVGIGIFVFKESLGPMEIIGVAMAIGSIIILMRFA